MQMECLFQQFCVQYDFGFWNENILHVKGGYCTMHDSQIVPKCEFWKWGYHYQIGILHILLNILLTWVHDTSYYVEMQKG